MTSPTWWAATVSTGWLPSVCLVERKCGKPSKRCQSLRSRFSCRSGPFGHMMWPVNNVQKSDSCLTCWCETTEPFALLVFKVGGVPGAKLQGGSLHPGEAWLQQLLRLGQPEQHRGLHAQNPLQLKTEMPPIHKHENLSASHTYTHFLLINCTKKKMLYMLFSFFFLNSTYLIQIHIF